MACVKQSPRMWTGDTALLCPLGRVRGGDVDWGHSSSVSSGQGEGSKRVPLPLPLSHPDFYIDWVGAAPSEDLGVLAPRADGTSPDPVPGAANPWAIERLGRGKPCPAERAILSPVNSSGGGGSLPYGEKMLHNTENRGRGQPRLAEAVPGQGMFCSQTPGHEMV